MSNSFSIRIRGRLPIKPLEGMSFIFMMVLYGIIPTIVSAKEKVNPPFDVRGKVTDAANGGPLSGVNVVVRGAAAATTTDNEGNFRISVSDSHDTLMFSFVGYNSMDVPINGRALINVQMTATAQSLNEMVVIGYGQQKKSDLTGAVAVVTNAQLSALPVPNLEQGLQGRAPGLNIAQSSGAPGASLRVRIRGSNSISYGNDPLYVIDGFPINSSPDNGNFSSNPAFGKTQGTSPLAFINPEDIESISILKDASATAIYGSRGANGVVVITTKKGKAGKAEVNFEAYTGVQQLTRKIPLLNAHDWATLDRTFYSRFRNGSLISRAYTEDQIAQMGKGTDWQDAIYRTAGISNYDLSIRGGNDKTRFALSADYFNQDGIIINSGYKKGTLNLSIKHQMSPRLSFGAGVIGGYIQDNAVSQGTDNQNYPGVVVSALEALPTLPVKNADGSYSSQTQYYLQTGIFGNTFLQNPVQTAEKLLYRKSDIRTLGNFYAQYEITDGLTAKVSANVDAENARLNTFIPSDFVVSQTTGGTGSIYTNQRTGWVNENTLTYDKTFDGKHHLNTVLGFTAQKEHAESATAISQNFFTNVVNYNNLGLGSNPQSPGSGVSEWALLSYLGRINYVYNGKYLFTLTGRYDGSSRFGSSNRYGFFPSGAFAWRVNEEDFLKDNNTISNLKFRVSYGVTGNQDIPLYKNVQTYSLGTPYTLGNKNVTSIVPSGLANNDLKWESTRQFDAGIDLGIFNNRLSIVADYYHKTTKDLLFNATLPAQGGFTSILQNVGSVENKGFEFQVNAVAIDRAFKWSISGNIDFNRNKVLKLNKGVDMIMGSNVSSMYIGGSASIIKVGAPIGAFYGYIFDGLWQTQAEYDKGPMAGNTNSGPGFENYRDVNGNGVFEEGIDRTIIGNPNPKYTFGISNDFSYKGFDLSFFIYGSQGNDVLNVNKVELTSQINQGNGLEIYKKAWDGEGTGNLIPKIDRPAGRSGTFPNRVSTFILEDGSFIKLRDLTLGYNLPLKSKPVLKRARIYLSAQNLFVITHYSGYDPEVNALGDDNTVSGVDMNNYPQARTCRIGFQLGF